MTKQDRRFAIAVATLVGAGSCGSATAQVAPDPATAPDTAQAGGPVQTVSADEIVVTAQRRSESLSRTPVAVSVLGSEALQKQGITSEADLQIAVSGLVVKAGSSSNQLNYAIRGQSLDAFSGVTPGVLPYLNEIQVAGGRSSAFYDLQSVQVLKGAARHAIWAQRHQRRGAVHLDKAGQRLRWLCQWSRRQLRPLADRRRDQRAARRGQGIGARRRLLPTP